MHFSRFCRFPKLATSFFAAVPADLTVGTLCAASTRLHVIKARSIEQSRSERTA